LPNPRLRQGFGGQVYVRLKFLSSKYAMDVCA